MAAAGPVPIFPTAWTVPQWEVDGSNSSGCASNSNSGTSATCVGGCAGSVCTSGIGPLLSCQELLTHRWGCNGVNQQCARLRQTTVVEWISPTTDTTDECYFAPAAENNSQFIERGVPHTVCSGTLANKTAKAHGPPAHLLQFDLCVGAAPYLFVLNTTRSSGAWINANVAGNTWSLGQPLPSPWPVPWNATDPPEDDTWANGDSYVVQSYPDVFLPVQAGTVNDEGSGVAFATYQQHLHNRSSFPFGKTTSPISTELFFVESRVDRLVLLSGLTQGLNAAATDGLINVYGGATTASVAGWKAGIINQQVNGSPLEAGVSMYLEAGVIVKGGPFLTNVVGQFNDVYIDTGVVISCTGACSANTYAGNTAPFIWGPGTVNVNAPGSLFIVANTATPTLLTSGGVELDALPTACSQTNAAPSVVNCGVTISGANVDANGGILLNPAGASYATLSSPF